MKKHFISFLVGLVLFGFGCGYIAFEIMNFEFVDTYPKGDFKLTEKEYNYSFDNNLEYYFYNEDGHVEVITDNTVEGIQVKIAYDNIFFNYNFLEQTSDNHPEVKEIYYSFDYIYNSKNSKRIYEIIKKNIKDKKIYDYMEVARPTIKVYVSEQNRNKVHSESYFNE